MQNSEMLNPETVLHHVSPCNASSCESMQCLFCITFKHCKAVDSTKIDAKRVFLKFSSQLQLATVLLKLTLFVIISMNNINNINV